ncbi:unnamed protein product [Protopolystoma xenopodis]|uniref:Uncharacterized protein n=1 Tax=Protopolystoma xenopodis TaxID=117903 RepID=A0A448X8J0_9PLAT|nr:unnamed protein product [Protopolystoma xenopodis]
MKALDGRFSSNVCENCDDAQIPAVPLLAMNGNQAIRGEISEEDEVDIVEAELQDKEKYKDHKKKKLKRKKRKRGVFTGPDDNAKASVFQLCSHPAKIPRHLEYANKHSNSIEEHHTVSECHIEVEKRNEVGNVEKMVLEREQNERGKEVLKERKKRIDKQEFDSASTDEKILDKNDGNYDEDELSLHRNGILYYVQARKPATETDVLISESLNEPHYALNYRRKK